MNDHLYDSKHSTVWTVIVLVILALTMSMCGYGLVMDANNPVTLCASKQQSLVNLQQRLEQAERIGNEVVARDLRPQVAMAQGYIEGRCK